VSDQWFSEIEKHGMRKFTWKIWRVVIWV